MGGAGYIAIAALILLLLPVVVLPWERRRVPETLYAAIAGGGLAAAGLQRGWDGVMWAAIAGAINLAAVAAIITIIRTYVNAQLVTAGHIWLLSAGSIWLGIYAGMAMVGISFAALFCLGVLQHSLARAQRPDFTAIAAIAILCVSLQQTIPANTPADARTASVER
jgi:prepilin signal peptidase PulO-like enzyme (type II secretory pathway)